MGRIDDKVAVVTGGARGIGRAVCRLFAREGAAVAVTDIVDDEGRELVAQIGEDGGKAAYWHLDTAIEENVVNVFAEIHTSFGGMDIRVNSIHPRLHMDAPGGRPGRGFRAKRGSFPPGPRRPPSHRPCGRTGRRRLRRPLSGL